MENSSPSVFLQSSTRSIAYGECAATLPVGAPLSRRADCHRLARYRGSIRVQRVQVWSEVLSQQIIVVALVSAEDASQFEMKERHWIGGQVRHLSLGVKRFPR